MRNHNISPETAGTLYGLLRERTRLSPRSVAYRQFDRKTGKWVKFTWPDVLARTDRFAAAFHAAGLRPGDRVGILLQNCVDWVCYDMAAARCGLTVVPLYTNDAISNGAFMLADARPRVVFIDTDRRWRDLEGALSEHDFIEEVWLQEVTADFVIGVDPTVKHLGDALPAEPGELPDPADDPDAPATLIYTSGTTGTPKGVMLSHRAVLENAAATASVVTPLENDIFLSILPMAHAFERTLGYALAVMSGACNAYPQSLLRLRQDMTTVRPTVIMGVPRFYETIHSSARRAAATSTLKARLFDMTGRIGYARHAARGGLGPGPSLGERLIWPVLDRLVGRKVRAAFGGRMRVAVSGGANMPDEIGRSLIGLGLPMVEGYGLSEAGPVATASLQEAYLPGTVGFPLPGVEVKLSERGELLLKTPARMIGYWQREDATAESFDREGWLHTGDLAEIRDGRIRIAGRLKHILVMSNGENVNPRPIELGIESDPLIEQVCVVGDGRPFLAALVVLNRDHWTEMATSQGLDENDPNAPAAGRHILERIRAASGDIPAWQQIKGYFATLDEWTVERRLITPTLKLRRERVIEEYKDEIRKIYAKG
ncbi:long-chain fatty acid--CoA ligase [Tropicimonas sp. IMCC6043]|uniref:AMP-dependent synthetase/ligase n=1 Tax=Tropicimonas sp. IMCC6043 TaxID=2510645 RepID=UPI00101C6C32|nr:long-chain fatty acid--CoA ligase [Tropicimonas sp. IMCC6043]RYH11244.1 long-chain fatty acid--CoA ligase [Tropicimonas sp. IMCC6043]